jgi:hypothetical protein
MLYASCIICGAEFRRAATGRPRLYCSNACRLKAQRDRRSDRVIGVLVGGAPGPQPELGSIAPEDILGPRARDPDEAVVESIMLARAVAAAFGVSSRRARPQLSWRCRRMADHIASGLDRYFKP